jgi:hypothetical protein
MYQTKFLVSIELSQDAMELLTKLIVIHSQLSRNKYSNLFCEIRDTMRKAKIGDYKTNEALPGCKF